MPETFKEGDKRHGSFYPKNCVVAILPSMKAAEDAKVELMRHNFRGDDVHAWGHEELFAKEETFTDDRNLIEKFVALHADEEKWMDEYRSYMDSGGILLTIYAPDADRLHEIMEVLEPFGAIEMRHYGSLVVSDLVPGKAPDFE